MKDSEALEKKETQSIPVNIAGINEPKSWLRRILLRLNGSLICQECLTFGYGRHEEWCSIGNNWLPEWWKT